MASIILKETGERIQVDESFFDLSENEQQRQVDEYLFNRELERDAVPAAQEKKGIEKILNIASKIAPYAGIALKTNPAGMLASASLTGGSRFVEGKTEGESNLQALKNAAIAAGIDLSTLGLGKVTGKIIKTKPVSSVLSQVGEFISSVPRKSIKKAIQDPSILKKTEDFEDVGQSAKDALSRQMTKVGQRAKKEKNILKRSDADIDLSTYAKREESLLDIKIGKTTKI